MDPEMDTRSLLVRLVTCKFCKFFVIAFPTAPLWVPPCLWFKFLIVLYLCEQDNGEVKCHCPPGFKGDGVKICDGKRQIYWLRLSVISSHDKN
jgi:hypothetical protein